MQNTEAKKSVRVAVGVVKNQKNEILISRRQEGQHLAGLWEFPGGKIELGETLSAALERELLEEVGIEVTKSAPLMIIRHEYPSKYVSLEVMLVDLFTGNAEGLEGQEVRWVPISALTDYEFPEANREIVTYLQNHQA